VMKTCRLKLPDHLPPHTAPPVEHI
jgi:hypothetical protein